ncbi:prepilin-type N-terminal cleavage/methylation domain-containing protein [Patescibacteria group bacterium]
MTKKTKNGFTIIEAVVSIAVITIAFWGFSELARYNYSIQEQNNIKTQAIGLASEAIEIIRGIRNGNWNDISSLTTGIDYYLNISAGNWILTTTNPGLINGIYTRRIRFEQVNRDANDNITYDDGSLDSGTKKIQIFVEWDNKGGTKQTSLSTYLTNWNE